MLAIRHSTHEPGLPGELTDRARAAAPPNCAARKPASSAADRANSQAAELLGLRVDKTPTGYGHTELAAGSGEFRLAPAQATGSRQARPGRGKGRHHSSPRWSRANQREASARRYRWAGTVTTESYAHGHQRRWPVYWRRRGGGD